VTTTADPEAGFQAADDPGSADPRLHAAVGSYDDLPDVAVQVVLTVPLAPPPQPPAPLQVAVPPARRQRSRGAHRHRTSRPRSATREAFVVGVAAAGVVFATVAVLLLVTDLLIG